MLSTALALRAAEPSVRPATVCEIAAALKTYEGQAVAVVGRYSFRTTGRSIEEDNCDYAHQTVPAVLKLVLDHTNAPRLPAAFAVEAPSLAEKIQLARQHTRLRAYPFGTPDYDRWAVVYGKVESSDAGKRLLVLHYAGDGYVIYLK